VGAVNRSPSGEVPVNAPAGDDVFCVITKEQADEGWEPSNEGDVLLGRESALPWERFEPAHPGRPAEGTERSKP
jgi:beta-lactamase class A